MAAMLIKKHKRFWTYKSLTMFSGVKLRKEEVSVFLYFFISVFLSSSICANTNINPILATPPSLNYPLQEIKLSSQLASIIRKGFNNIYYIFDFGLLSICVYYFYQFQEITVGSQFCYSLL